MNPNRLRDWLDSPDALRAKELADQIMEMAGRDANRHALLLSAEHYALLVDAALLLAVREGSTYVPIQSHKPSSIFGMPVVIAPVERPALLPRQGADG